MKLDDVSIDYAVMEKSDKLAVLTADVGWSDLGSWSSVYDKSEKDSDNNVISGNAIVNNCTNSLIYGSNNLLATIGLNNVAVIDTEDAILICDLDKTQDVKSIYNELKERKDTTYKVHKTQLRPWGYHTLLKEEDKFKIRNVCVKPDCQSSLHLHYHINKHWTVVDGIARVIIDDKDFFLHPGESIDIKATQKHQISNPGIIDLKIIEVQTGSYIGDDDIVRF
jgi:mannose-1-phosphate guanylyltransferase